MLVSAMRCLILHVIYNGKTEDGAWRAVLADKTAHGVRFLRHKTAHGVRKIGKISMPYEG